MGIQRLAGKLLFLASFSLALGLAPAIGCNIDSAIDRAESGNPEAQVNLGNMHYHGDCVPQSFEEAARWYQSAADMGDPEAQYYLGLMHMYGEGVTLDHSRAAILFEESARQGDADSQYELGALYLYSDALPLDYEKAVEWFERSASQRHPGAQYELGYLYLYGEGVEPDESKGLELIQLSADQGQPEALYELGDIYYYGELLTLNYSKAAELYMAAADYGHPDAQYSLGYMYQYGQGVAQNNEEAVRWLSLAIDQGNSDAQASLADMHYEGRGMERSVIEAAMLWRASAENENSYAQFMLGELYAAGDGVEEDLAKAAKWHQKAALQEHSDSQAKVALLFLEEGAVPNVDPVASYSWMLAAIENGYVDEEGLLGEIAELLAPVQRDAAERISARCIESGYEDCPLPHTGNRPARLAEDGAEIYMEEDAHFYITLLVDGMPVRFLIDTGATSVTLSPLDAQRIGFDVSDSDYTMFAETANGTVRSAPVELESIKLGKFTDRDIQAGINEAEMSESLLGMDYLRLFDEITFKGKRLILKR